MPKTDREPREIMYHVYVTQAQDDTIRGMVERANRSGIRLTRGRLAWECLTEGLRGKQFSEYEEWDGRR